MRKLKNLLLVTMILCLVSGCGNQSKKYDSNSEIDNDGLTGVEDYADEDNEYLDEDLDLSEYVFDSEGEMDGNVIIRPTCMLLLKNDGTVVGKGNSSYGELGNGERIDCESWTPVLDLGGVKKIYADQGVGTFNLSDNSEYAFCYAFTEEGTVYRWGGNVLRPEEFLYDVKDFFDCGNDAGYYSSCFAIEYNDGHTELIAKGGYMTEIFDITDIVKKDEILYATSKYMIVKDANSGMSYYVDLEVDRTKEIDEQHSIYRAKCKEIARYKIGKNVDKVGSASNDHIYLISGKGAVRSFVVENNSVSFDSGWSGRGYKSYNEIKYTKGDNSFALLGENVETIGENEYGQLGDGTTLEYWSDWISVDEFDCVDLWAGESDWGPYCVALDVNHNIWCWGGYFGSTPKIEVEINFDDDMVED